MALATARRHGVAVSVPEVLGDVPSVDVVEALLLTGVFDQIDTLSADRVLEHVGRLAAHVRNGRVGV